MTKQLQPCPLCESDKVNRMSHALTPLGYGVDVFCNDCGCKASESSWQKYGRDKSSMNNPAAVAIEYALTDSEGMEFLRCWNEGDFDSIRREWGDVPEEVFINADPSHPMTNVE